MERLEKEGKGLKSVRVEERSTIDGEWSHREKRVESGQEGESADRERDFCLCTLGHCPRTQ